MDHHEEKRATKGVHKRRAAIDSAGENGTDEDEEKGIKTSFLSE